MIIKLGDFLNEIFNEFTDLCKQIRWGVLFNVLLASILLGFIVHELINVFLLAHPTDICLHIGESSVIMSVCCLTEEEMKTPHIVAEIIPFYVQFLVMFLWIIANMRFYTKPSKKKL